MYCFHKQVSGQLTVYSTWCLSEPCGKWVPKSLKCTGPWAIWGTIRCGYRTCAQGSRWDRQSSSTSGTSLREVTSRERECGKWKEINLRSGPQPGRQHTRALEAGTRRNRKSNLRVDRPAPSHRAIHFDDVLRGPELRTLPHTDPRSSLKSCRDSCVVRKML